MFVTSGEMGDLPAFLQQDDSAIFFTPPASPKSESLEVPDALPAQPPPVPEESTYSNDCNPSAGKPLTLAEYRRQKANLAFYESIEDATRDLGMAKVKTMSHKNCCLMFAYLVGTKEMQPKQQQKEYAAV